MFLKHWTFSRGNYKCYVISFNLARGFIMRLNKTDSKAEFIGFYDLFKNLICIRDIVEYSEGTYFNIADNDQPEGTFSASDNYSIFNGGSDQGFFELETIGAAVINGNCLRGSKLKSRTSFAIFKSSQQVQDIIVSFIGT